MGPLPAHEEVTKVTLRRVVDGRTLWAMASRRSVLDVLDTWLLIVVGILAAVFVWNVLGWVFGVVAFLIKVAVVALVVAVAVRIASGRRELRSGRRRELNR